MLFAPCEGFDQVQISANYVLTMVILSVIVGVNLHALFAGGIMCYSPELLNDELESSVSLMKCAWRN